MPVAVNPVNAKNDDASTLAAALNVATSLFRVSMDDRQAKRALAATKQKEDDLALREKDKLGQQFDLAWSPAKQGDRGATLVPHPRTGIETWVVPREDLQRQAELSSRERIAIQDRADKSQERTAKAKENSAIENKQLGLADLGLKAEEQYQIATANKKDYDPTQTGQIFDNSSWAPNWMKNDKAIKAQAAMSSWVEAFLRDASGAAIPPSERMAYAQDYFPMPGDPPDVVADKADLRQQKMTNALRGGNLSDEQIAQKFLDTSDKIERGVAALKNKRVSATANDGGGLKLPKSKEVEDALKELRRRGAIK